MQGLLELFDLIFRIIYERPIVASATLLFLAFSVVVWEYKQETWSYLWHKRNKWHFAGVLLLTAVNIYLGKQRLICPTIFFCVLVFILILFAWTIYQAMPITKSPNHNLFLRRYWKAINEGKTIECIGFFEGKNPWYIFGMRSKLEYQLLKKNFFTSIHDYTNAYKGIEGIKAAWLYKSECTEINNKKANLLALVGNMRAAEELLGPSEKNQSHDPDVWITYSFIAENSGDIEKALHHAEKACGIVDGKTDASDDLKGRIYNNYGRIAMINGKNEEALHYFDLAWKHAKRSKNIQLIQDIAENRIIRMTVLNRSKQECEKALSEYEEITNEDSIMNRLEYANCKIKYYRQIHDTQMEYQLIKEEFDIQIKKLNQKQKIIYTSSVFAILMNGHYEYKWIVPFISADYHSYSPLSPLEKLTVFQTYMGFFQQIELGYLTTASPFCELKQTIIDYYYREAICDINMLLEKTESYNILAYSELVLMKLNILSITEQKKHINMSKDTYLYLANSLKDKGRLIDSLQVLIVFLDKCISPYHTTIKFIPFKEMYLCDFFETLPPPPQPRLLSDGIHLDHFSLELYSPFRQRVIHADIVNEYSLLAIEIWRKLKNHPYKIQAGISIANILCAIGKTDVCKEFLSFFEENNYSDLHLSSFLREEIRSIKISLQQQ